ncbi:unnamed protein product, partial [Arabidopsis halleri]
LRLSPTLPLSPSLLYLFLFVVIVSGVASRNSDLNSQTKLRSY